jgi:hypothetical protein
MVSAAATALLYGLLLFSNPYNFEEFTVEIYWIAAIMIFLALLAVWAAVRLNTTFMFVVFIGLFFPEGLYMLGMPGLFRWIGAANLIYLVALCLASYGGRGRRIKLQMYDYF